VQAGDTASSIAHKHGVSVQKLCADNGWDNPLEDVKAGIKAVIKREAKKALPGVPDSVWKRL
jgi:LysM repeat protein